MSEDGSTRTDVQALLATLVKLALVGEGADEVAGWRAEALALQGRVVADPGALAALHPEGCWAAAVKMALRDPVVRRDETANPILPVAPPVDLAALFVTPFRLDDVAHAIRDASSFG